MGGEEDFVRRGEVCVNSIEGEEDSPEEEKSVFSLWEGERRFVGRSEV